MSKPWAFPVAAAFRDTAARRHEIVGHGSHYRPSSGRIRSRTSTSVASGSRPANAVRRSLQSRLFRWSARMRPSILPPDMTATSKGYALTVELIGQASASCVRALYSRGILKP
jgi:hypothetical protein